MSNLLSYKKEVEEFNKIKTSTFNTETKQSSPINILDRKIPILSKLFLHLSKSNAKLSRKEN